MKTLLLIAVIGSLVARAQGVSDEGLARLLVNDSTRRAAIASIVTSRHEKVPILLSWTRTPPPELNDIDQYVLRASMAEIFGQLRTKEAIPFLIENMNLRSSLLLSPNVWMKGPEAIEERMPAVSALIKIGPAAFDTIIHSPVEPLRLEDRLAGIFVVSRIATVMNDAKALEEAHTFLRVALAEANLQRVWAEEGLKHLPEGR